MRNVFGRSTAALIAAGLVSLATASDPAAARDAGAFSSLAGTWSGSGQMRFEGGRTERISCRAYYTPRDGGSAVSMALRCASKDNRIEMRASLSSSGGRVSGDWEERTFNAGGNATGRASGGSMTLAISGSLSGTLQVSTSGGRQSVSITTSGVSLQGVSINLSKG